MKPFFFIACLLLFAQCAGSYNGNLEDARFALDQGNYSAAITAGNRALDAKPGDPAASRIVASAYFGLSGLSFLDLGQQLVDLDGASGDNFQLMADAMVDGADIDQLRLAITTLQAVTGIDDVTTTSAQLLRDAAFDLGAMQAIEHFALGVIQANYFTTLDVTDITADDLALVLEDLLQFDNYLIGSGVDASENGFVAEVRQTYCILEDVSAGDGFTLAEYQALVGCQLESGFDPSALTADIPNCAALAPASQSASVQSCYDDDTI